MQEEIAKLSTSKHLYILGMPSPMMSLINLMQKHKAIMSEKQTTEGNNDRMHKS
jgi:hypothetical protein